MPPRATADVVEPILDDRASCEHVRGGQDLAGCSTKTEQRLVRALAR